MKPFTLEPHNLLAIIGVGVTLKKGGSRCNDSVSIEVTPNGVTVVYLKNIIPFYGQWPIQYLNP